jgi:hypothetical protein
MEAVLLQGKRVNSNPAFYENVVQKQGLNMCPANYRAVSYNEYGKDDSKTTRQASSIISLSAPSWLS